MRDARGKIELSSSDEDRVLRAEHDDELFLANGQTDTAALRGDLLSFEAYSILPDVLRTPQPPKNELVLSASGENLTSIFKMLSRSRSHKQAREEIISSLRLAMPSLEDIRVRSLGGLMMPMFRVSETDGRHDFNVSQISDGTLRLLGLLTALYQPRGPDVLALEEPEQTMHPAVLAVLADAIRDVSERRQILVTTHSPHMVEHFRADEIRTVEIRDGETSVRPLSGDQQKAVREHLFTLGELMAMEGLHS
ncbi:MAG TPA: AAA family ATPase [Thermoanaerobaculia bacterium]